MSSKNTYAIIPAHNEEKRVGNVIKKAKKYLDNIVVVDDGSSDSTSEVAKDNGAIVLTHVINLGKGAAARTGCDYAVSKGADLIILIDADGQHDPSEIPNFLEALKGRDIVFGYRRFNKNMPAVFKIGNNLINLFIKLLYNMDLKDTQGGYRAFTSDAYKKLRWDSSDYAMESEMISNAGKYNLKYAQIPIQTIYLDRYKGTTVLDGIKIITNLLLWRLKR